jgi:type I restriction enzyme S subunit
MLKLSFQQTRAEIMVRAAATLIFNVLTRAGQALVPLSDLTENPQYGFTASAASAPVGPKFVRITDLQNAGVNWDTVPYCECKDPERYLLQPNDLLFARTGATTGKTHLVTECPRAVFASYLIRLRPKPIALAEYLYSFFQSDSYWSQISESKEGSAQPNVNGRKLMSITVPLVNPKTQSDVRGFLKAVRDRQEGRNVPLPELSSPLAELHDVVLRIERISAKVDEALLLRRTALEQTNQIMSAEEFEVWPDIEVQNTRTLDEVTTFLARGRHSKQGPSDHYLIKTQHVQMGRYIKTNMTLSVNEAQRVRPEAMVKPHDILIACSAAGCLGRVALYDGPSVSASTDTHVAIARANPEIVVPKYLFYYLKGAQGQYQLRSREKGDWKREKISFRLTELNVADMRRVPVPVPPIPEQYQIIERLDRLLAKVDAIKELQSETKAELSSLMPSILSKAFRGELKNYA